MNYISIITKDTTLAFLKSYKLYYVKLCILLKIHLRCTLYSSTSVSTVNTSRVAAPCWDAVPTVPAKRNTVDFDVMDPTNPSPHDAVCHVPSRLGWKPQVSAKRPPSPGLRNCLTNRCCTRLREKSRRGKLGSLRHDGDGCRQEWRHGTQECVRHKRIGRLEGLYDRGPFYTRERRSELFVVVAINASQAPDRAVIRWVVSASVARNLPIRERS